MQVNVSFHISEEDRDALKEIGARRGVAYTNVIKSFIKRGLEDEQIIREVRASKELVASGS